MTNIIFFEEISSTNDYLKENYKTLPNYMGAFADFQTKGRGRMGRVWQGTKGQNIAFSILVKEFNQDQNIANLTLCVAAAVFKLLSKYAPLTIKWPNDILYESKKLVGILCEGVSYNDKVCAVVIGIGININQKEFDESLKDISTSLSLINNQVYNIKDLVSELYDILVLELTKYFDGSSDYIKIIKDNLYAKNKLISFIKNNEICEGYIIDIDEEGNLIIDIKGVKHCINSGEIKIIR